MNFAFIVAKIVNSLQIAKHYWFFTMCSSYYDIEFLNVTGGKMRNVGIHPEFGIVICFVEFLFLYPDDSWCAECRDIYDQTKDAM